MKEMIPRSNSDNYCLKLEPKDKPLDIHDSQVKGLVFRIAPNGAKSWILRYHYKEGNEWKQRKTSLGPFRLSRSDSTGLTVTAARTEAERIKNQVKHNGADPVADRRKRAIHRAIEKANLVDVRELFEKWANTDLIKRKDKGSEARRMMEKDVLPFIGNFDVKEVSKRDILGIIDQLLKKRGVNRMAKVVFSLIRQMFRFAVLRDYLEVDPTALLSKKHIGGANIERDRVLNEEEITELVLKLPKANMTETSIIAIWITLATCCRIGELLKTRWAHVDLERREWIIPSENSKNDRQHIIFLSSFATAQFKKLYEITGGHEWCFYSIRTESCICSKTVTKQVSDRQKEENPHSKRSKNTTSLILSRGVWKPHDLRRTGATLMNSLGVLPEVAERCLNHTEENKVKRIYQRYGYEKEMKDAWELLGTKLNQLINITNEKIIKLDERIA
ncbi:Prophage CP4-57 integrase [Candidatus Rubidus massiliensis]|nr:Prophage CP4-57 integrase [Candidatus Rubidus massiliensis]